MTSKREADVLKATRRAVAELARLRGELAAAKDLGESGRELTQALAVAWVAAARLQAELSNQSPEQSESDTE